MSNRVQVLGLYRQLLRESKKFTSYNFRDYAKHRIHHEFELNKQVTDPAKINLLIKKAENDLSSLKRQVIVSQLFPVENSHIN